MKKLVLILIVLSIFCSSANAQFWGKSRIINHSGDALFIGWNNKLELKNKKIDLKAVKVICSYGKVTLENGLFVVKIPLKKDIKKKYAVITFFTAKNGNKKIIGRVKYPIKVISKPTAQLAGMTSGKISLKKLKNATEVSIFMEEFPEDFKYEVFHYKFVFVPKGGNASLYSIKGSELSDLCVKLIKNSKEGDIIICSDIYVITPIIWSRQLPGAIVLTVVK